MCGIAIKYKDNFCDHKRMAHRGIVKGTVRTDMFTLTHYKLPLQTGLNDQYNQPIELPNGNYLMFNGEIFNYPVGFQNDVDYLMSFFSDDNWLDNLINAQEYQTWDGFWAICIVTKDKIYAFTDPLGKKQLYYKDGCISSEIKPLLETNERDHRFSFDEILESGITPFQNVRRFLPNVLYEIEGKKVMSINRGLFDLTFPAESDYFVGMMGESVRKRLINTLDHNTLFVSGGLDSTIILYHLHEQGVLQNFQLLTIDNDEDAKYIHILEEYFNCKVERINEFAMSAELDDVVKAYESPIERGSLIQQYRLCFASTGSVLFSGDGADELFSGYNRALRSDTQDFDVFVELPYYHHLRLDRIPMKFTKELRSPFLDHEIVRYALGLPYEQRKGKKILKDSYRGLIPDEIIDRKKSPLRESDMFVDRKKYLNNIISTFNSIDFSK